MEKIPQVSSRRDDPARLLSVLGELLEGKREQLLHDSWTLRAMFTIGGGPWRRMGFASRVLIRAAVAEMDRMGAICADPMEAAFWILVEQRRLLNHDVVDERFTRALFASLDLLRPSQQRAARRILQSRTENLLHGDGRPATNLLLLSVVAGGLAWVQDLDSYRAALEVRFGGDPPLRTTAEASVILLGEEEKIRLDERAIAFDLAHRRHGRAPS